MSLSSSIFTRHVRTEREIQQMINSKQSHYSCVADVTNRFVQDSNHHVKRVFSFHFHESSRLYFDVHVHFLQHLVETNGRGLSQMRSERGIFTDSTNNISENRGVNIGCTINNTRECPLRFCTIDHQFQGIIEW